MIIFININILIIYLINIYKINYLLFMKENIILIYMIIYMKYILLNLLLYIMYVIFLFTLNIINNNVKIDYNLLYFYIDHQDINILDFIHHNLYQYIFYTNL